MANPLPNTHTNATKTAILPTQTPFVCRATKYIWSEGEALMTHKQVLRDPHKRIRAYKIFTQSLISQFERRGIEPMVVDASRPSHSDTPISTHWMAWSDVDSAPVWGLFAEMDQSTVEPADNDRSRCIAWGDGPVLAWADEDPAALDQLRAALQTLPPWLRGGMVSMDAVFPVQIRLETPTARKSAAVRHSTEQASVMGRRASGG